MDASDHQPWKDRVRRPDTVAIGTRPIPIEQYDEMAESLINESSILGIIGNLNEFKDSNPAQHQELIRLVRMAALFEVGEATQILPAGASADTYRRIAGLLDDHMAIHPRHAERSPQDVEIDATRCALEFKALCREETVQPDGIIACSLKNALVQLHQPVSAMPSVARPR